MRSLPAVALVGLSLFLFTPGSAQAQYYPGGAGPSYYYSYYNGMPYSSLIFRSPYTGYTTGRIVGWSPYTGFNVAYYTGYQSPWTGQYFPVYSTPNLQSFPGYYGPSSYYLPYASFFNNYSPYSSPGYSGYGSYPYWLY
jgi:hypothetical protein